MQFEWPGNIRELENEIERALTLAGDGEEIDVACLSEKIVGSRATESEAAAENVTLQDAVERLERHMVFQALQASKGNRSQEARLLGLTRQGLLNKINRYQITA